MTDATVAVNAKLTLQKISLLVPRVIGTLLSLEEPRIPFNRKLKLTEELPACGKYTHKLHAHGEKITSIINIFTLKMNIVVPLYTLVIVVALYALESICSVVRLSLFRTLLGKVSLPLSPFLWKKNR